MPNAPSGSDGSRSTEQNLVTAMTPKSETTTGTHAQVQQPGTPNNGVTKYGRDLAERRFATEIRECVDFGLLMGWVSLLGGVGCFYCYPGEWDWLWITFTTCGFLFLATTVVLPQLLSPLRKAWMFASHLWGRLMMTVLLAILYYCVISPLGVLRRTAQGPKSFLSWSESNAGKIPTQGWTDLAPLTFPDPRATNQRRRGPIGLFLGMVSALYERGSLLLLLLLIPLIFLGLLFYFVQSSVIAPFIYPLF